MVRAANAYERMVAAWVDVYFGVRFASQANLGRGLAIFADISVGVVAAGAWSAVKLEDIYDYTA